MNRLSYVYKFIHTMYNRSKSMSGLFYITLYNMKTKR